MPSATPTRKRTSAARCSCSGYCTAASAVMVQRELEFASVRVSGNTPNGGPFHEYRTQTLLGPGEGSHSAASSAGEAAGLRPVRPVRHPSDPLLPLAEGVLRERGRCL